MNLLTGLRQLFVFSVEKSHAYILLLDWIGNPAFQALTRLFIQLQLRASCYIPVQHILLSSFCGSCAIGKHVSCALQFSHLYNSVNSGSLTLIFGAMYSA